MFIHTTSEFWYSLQHYTYVIWSYVQKKHWTRRERRKIKEQMNCSLLAYKRVSSVCVQVCACNLYIHTRTVTRWDFSLQGAETYIYMYIWTNRGEYTCVNAISIMIFGAVCKYSNKWGNYIENDIKEKEGEGPNELVQKKKWLVIKVFKTPGKFWKFKNCPVIQLNFEYLIVPEHLRPYLMMKLSKNPWNTNFNGLMLLILLLFYQMNAQACCSSVLRCIKKILFLTLLLSLYYITSILGILRELLLLALALI